MCAHTHTHTHLHTHICIMKGHWCLFQESKVGYLCRLDITIDIPGTGEPGGLPSMGRTESVGHD